MPQLSDTYRRLPLSKIVVLRDSRQRREIDTTGLEDSIRRNGVLNPIIVREYVEDDIYILVAGERRLEASRKLGLSSIPVRLASELSPTEAQIIELEENIKRSDLPWQDLVQAVARIHSLYLKQDPDWTQDETCSALSLTKGTISLYLDVAPNLSEAKISNSDTVREAYNILQRRRQRAAGEALEELLQMPEEETRVELPSGEILVFKPPPGPVAEPQPALSESILHTSFLEWAPQYSGPRFNFLHCDFPYGINPFSGLQGVGNETDLYEDSPQIYFALLNCLVSNFHRLASVSSHLLFWYSDKFRDETFQRLSSIPDLKIHPFPLIWLKSDNAGIASDPRRGPRHIYETCLFCTYGERHIVRVMADAYSCPTDHRVHPSCKPESMLRHFFQMLVDETTSLLDPTCGSGSALRAAESLEAQRVLGLESDWKYCEASRLALRNFRTLRAVEI